MIKKIYHNIYSNEIPLPNNPLRAINSYIILSEDRNLIIDTGFNRDECREALFNGIKELNIDLNKTDLLVTHLHSDHSGLAAALNKEGVKIYAGKIDGGMINRMTEVEYWEKFKAYGEMFGLMKDNMTFDDHPGYRYCPKEPIEFTPLEEGDTIHIGEYSFEIIDIPGHTPGHIGLYEKKHKIFFCGDHILNKITPNIAFWGFQYGDILSVYFDSLRKVYEYDIDHLFSAHRSIVEDHKKRIDELLEHHEKRLDEIIEIIKDDKKTVRDIAADMHWDLRYDCWEDFPNPQKWFASGEAMSHLEHLVAIGRAKRTEEKGILYYCFNK
jgi:glyoxylase-like metal-dependent hydrolase (beta-lactamase superfamily II)